MLCSNPLFPIIQVVFHCGILQQWFLGMHMPRYSRPDCILQWPHDFDILHNHVKLFPLAGVPPCIWGLRSLFLIKSYFPLKLSSSSKFRWLASPPTCVLFIWALMALPMDGSIITLGMKYRNDTFPDISTTGFNFKSTYPLYILGHLQHRTTEKPKNC